MVIINGKCKVLTFMFINILYVLFRFPTFGATYFCKVIFSLFTCGTFVLMQGILDHDQWSVALSVIGIVPVWITFCINVSTLSHFSFQCNSVNSVCGGFSRRAWHVRRHSCQLFLILSQQAATSSVDASVNPWLVKQWRWKISCGRLKGISLSYSIFLFMHWFAQLNSQSEWFLSPQFSTSLLTVSQVTAASSGAIKCLILLFPVNTL